MEFVSYSRKDTAFVRRLSDGLKQSGHEVWVDWEDIPPTADWRSEISKGIQSSHSFIFVISPDSVRSEVCRDEIELAVHNSKRFVPVLYRDLNEETHKSALHPTISSHNWIFFREEDDFDASMEKLISALRTDLDHVGEHTRLLVRAIEWDEKGRDASLLLNGTEITRAEAWLSSGINKTPEPTELHSEYIFASRQQQSRRQRNLLIGVSVALVVAVTLAIISLALLGVANHERIRAENNRATAVAAQSIAEVRGNQAASLALAANARNLVVSHNPNLGLSLALAAYQVNQPPMADIQRTLADTIYAPAARFRTQGHEKSIMDVAFSADGTVTGSVGLDGKLILREALTGVQQRVIETGAAASLDFSPDSELIVTGLMDGQVVLWDAATGEEVRRWQAHEDSVTSALFSPDGERILTGSLDRTIRLWERASGKELLVINSPGAIFKLAYDPLGEWAVSGAGDSNPADVSAPDTVVDRTVRVWDLQTGEERFQFDPGSGFVRAVAFSPDGDFVLSGTWSQTVGSQLQLWSLTKDSENATFYGPTDIISDVAFSPDGELVFASSWDGSIRSWEISTGLEFDRFQGHDDRVQAMALHPSGEYILTGTGNTGSGLPDPDTDQPKDVSLWLWDLQNRAAIDVIEGHEDWVWSVDYHPGGRYIASGSGPLSPPATDASVRLWDVGSGEELALLDGHTATVSGVTFNHDGTLLATSSWDGTVRLWAIDAGEDGLSVGEGRVAFDTTPARVNSVAFSADSTKALSALSDNTVRLWDVATGEELLRLEGHERPVYSAVFSPDERYILSGAEDRTARIWDVATGEVVHVLEGHQERVNGVDFSPDGRLAVTTSWDTTARLWDVASGQEIRQFVGHTLAVFSADFSPDGRTLITGSADQTARLWDVGSGQEIRQFNGHTNWLLSVKFSPDGSTALSGAEDDLLILWRAEPLTHLIEWGYSHRYVPVLSCPERLQYNVEPFCDEAGNLPEPTITPTPNPTATPEVTATAEATSG